MLDKFLVEMLKELIKKYIVIMQNKLNELGIEYLTVYFSIDDGSKYCLNVMLYDTNSDGTPFFIIMPIFLHDPFNESRCTSLLQSYTSRDIHSYKKYNYAHGDIIQLKRGNTNGH